MTWFWPCFVFWWVFQVFLYEGFLPTVNTCCSVHKLVFNSHIILVDDRVVHGGQDGLSLLVGPVLDSHALCDKVESYSLDHSLGSNIIGLRMMKNSVKVHEVVHRIPGGQGDNVQHHVLGILPCIHMVGCKGQGCIVNFKAINNSSVSGRIKLKQTQNMTFCARSYTS